MLQGTVSAAFVRGFLDFAVKNGVSKELLLEGTKFSLSDLTDLDRRIPLEKYRQLIHESQKICNDSALALRWGATVDMSEISVVGLVMKASRTMGEAFEQLERYTSLVLDLDVGTTVPRFVLLQQNNELWMVDKRQNPNQFPEISETSFARLVCGPRQFLEQPHVLEVHFTHDQPDHHVDYERIFQCPVRFSRPWNAMKLHPQVADWPVALEPDYVFGILTQHADTLLEKVASPTSVRAQVEALVMPVLHTGNITAGDITTKIGMSRQTLYRKLREEGSSFKGVIASLRKKLAIEYLHAGKTSISEIAYLLGFSDPASFSRAFKRWTGKSPKEELPKNRT
ncbi:MAG: AraC family transcriptional regulator [Kordiimonadaceae bacterium]|nr:AraC family transcriptional regulator [Kordiimonadaceae bacterium]